MLICGDAIDYMIASRGKYQCVFADPPDNIGLEYSQHNDNLDKAEYAAFMGDLIEQATKCAPIVWLSFNARWTITVATLAAEILRSRTWEIKPCVQTFTFGQHNKHDLGNCHRPLWRFRHREAPIYPEQIKIASWRQQNGDKRAAPGGRVPGDVFDFPRVTGNSKQRRKWHPTQLHEGLVERCIKLSTNENDWVLDPFAGTGTTYRVCDRIGRLCDLVEIDPAYCAKIREEFPGMAYQERQPAVCD